MTKILLVDDHPFVRLGIIHSLENAMNFEYIHEANNGSELINMILKNEYDIVLLDISLPGRSGLDLLREIKKLKPELKVLIVSMHSEEQYAIRSLKLGASGYITKSAVPNELIIAIRMIIQGKKYITTSLAEKIAHNLDSLEENPKHDKLSERELEVMCMLGQGKTNNEIAQELSLSPKTISTYRERILEKLNMNSTADIIRYALKEGLVN